MIYIETIADDLDCFRIERQKDKPKGNWYEITLVKVKINKDTIIISDNDTYILGILYGACKPSITETFDYLKISYDKADVKTLKKIIRKADKLGWFYYLSDVGVVSENSVKTS
jgi:hypothetical protein